MGIAITWDDPQQSVLLITYDRFWTWVEFDNAVKDVFARIEQTDHTIHLIFDVTKSPFPPDGAMWRFKRVASVKHSHTGQIIFVGGNLFIQSMANAILRLVKKHDFIFVRSLDDARKLVAQAAVLQT
ncbi:MAG: hypothetical protein IT324_08880 [Anaerolineae bacterium]|nr:hypothetical protein [Anaerolineae bacterium]